MKRLLSILISVCLMGILASCSTEKLIDTMKQREEAISANLKTLLHVQYVLIAVVLIVFTFFTSIFPIISFAFETLLPERSSFEKETARTD